jgi:phosphate:Na+ symporter
MGATMSILTPFLGGLGLFIYAMQVLANGLEDAAGNRLKKLLQVLIKNKFMGVLLGFGVTAIIQSSTTTTVMVVGFVNSGVMNLSQAIGVVMGANVGTTLTAWIIASGEWAGFLNPSNYAPLAIAIGVFMMILSRRKATKDLSNILLGFGMLMVGMSTMSAAVSPLRESEVLHNLFVHFGENPLLGILAGAVVTVIVFSSTASVGILQSLAIVGLVPFNAAVFIIMGQNIGTTVTALLSSIGAKKAAKTAALMHLLFSVFGTIIFVVVAMVLFNVINPALASRHISQTEISLVHTVFNVGSLLILYPFSELLVKLAKKISKVEDVDLAENKLHLDDRVLETPAIALQTSIGEVGRMGAVVLDIWDKTETVLFKESASDLKRILEGEKEIDQMCADASEYLIKISSKSNNENDIRQVANLLSVISDFERISDYCENIAESAKHLAQLKGDFSQVAKEELENMIKVCGDSYRVALKAFVDHDPVLAKEAIELERKSDELEMTMRSGHMKRLSSKACSSEVGIIFLDTIVNLERISDHARNIAEVVLEEQ